MKAGITSIKNGLGTSRTGGLVAFVLVALLALVLLGFQIRGQLRALQTAPTDNVQWNFSQLEVELLRLDTAVNQAQITRELKHLRQRFDLFYSRVEIVAASFRSIDLDCFTTQCRDLSRLQVYTKDLAKLIDGPDADLLSETGNISQSLQAQRPKIRQVSLQAVAVFVAASDAKRRALSVLLATTGGVAALLFLTLNFAFIVLFRTYQTAIKNGDESRRARARLQSTVEASLDAVLVIDQTGVLIDYNHAAQQLFGYSQTEILGQDISRLILSEDFSDQFHTSPNTGSGPLPTDATDGRFQLRARKNTGEDFPVEATLAKAAGDKNPIYVSFIHDISEREQVRLNLIKARDDALAAEKTKSDFIAIMSHEMRTPLNGVLATLELLSGSTLSQKQETLVTIAKTSGDKLLAHIEDVLQISSIESGVTSLIEKSFSPQELVQNLCKQLDPLIKANGNRLDLKRECNAQDWVLGDPDRLETILQNLISNANKFTRNGVITVNVSLETSDRNQRDLTVRVQDTGHGIPFDMHSRIFDDFVSVDTAFNRQAEGTGLGLGIARRLARSLQGEIDVKSDLGRGSVFTVRVPFKSDPSKTDDVNDPNPPKPFIPNGLSVLVVEDNEINRTIACEMLKESNAIVSQAENGAQGVSAALDKRYDMILMDISMPVMDGLQATGRIRAQGKSKDTPIFAYTAHAQPDDFNRFKAAGMFGVLTKPITRSQIQSALLQLPQCNQASKTNRSNNLESPASAKSALVDPKHTSELKDVLGQAGFCEMLLRYKAETTASLSALLVPHTESRQTLAGEIHKLAGAAGTMGATGFNALLLDAEVKLRNDERYELDVSRIDECWHQTRAQLDALTA